jgi:hypothetical protein
MDCIFKDNIIKSIIECDIILEELKKLEKYDVYYYLSILTIIICILSIYLILTQYKTPKATEGLAKHREAKKRND